ncbi:MAG: type II secretion system F family protein [Vampirovibrionales bacterium]|nr:type II secretion system F family protein [Vampirovibrionales bacterium]
MVMFAYQVLDPATSKTLEGVMEAASIFEAKKKLRDSGAIPIRIQESKSRINASSGDARPWMRDILWAFPFIKPKIALADLVIITQQLYTLLDAGVPLVETLYLLEKQALKPHIKEIFRELRTLVIAGDSFSSALGHYPGDFPPVYRNLIKAGEVSGNLDEICLRLSILLEKNFKLQKKISGAMVYPIFTIVVIILAIVIIMTVIVPKFVVLFARMDLPLPTIVLIYTSNLFVHYWWLMIASMIGGSFWFNALRKGPGRLLVDQWVLTLPLFGDLLRKIYVSRLVRTMATLVGAGISLTESVSVAASTVDNCVLRHGLDKAMESLYAGTSLSKPMEQTKLFPTMVVRMIAVGEESGGLEKMMAKASDYLDEETDKTVELMTTLIEPIMIIVLGGVLLWVALSLYMPLFNMHKAVNL